MQSPTNLPHARDIAVVVAHSRETASKQMTTNPKQEKEKIPLDLETLVGLGLSTNTYNNFLNLCALRGD